MEEVRWIRKAGLDLVVNAKREIAPEDVAHIANNISRTPELVMLKETKVAGLRGTTSLSDNRFPELWEEFLRLHKDLFIAAGAGYCICETQQTAYTKDGDVLFAAMAESPVHDVTVLPPSLSLEQKVLRAGKFAVLPHRGTLANLFKTYQYIFGIWLQTAKAGYKAFLNRRNCERSLKSSYVPFFVAGDDFPPWRSTICRTL